jgi:hypothetical protein
MARQVLERIVREALVELARYHRCVVAAPAGLKAPRKNTSAAWTKAELDFFKLRLDGSGLDVRREHKARMRLPPDLVAFNRGRLVLHLERETRGWEWNDVIGGLVKMFLVPQKPAPISVLVLAGVRGEPQERLDLILLLARKLLAAARGVRCLYLALWMGKQWENAAVLKLSLPPRKGGKVNVRELVAME